MATKGFVSRTIMWVLGAAVLIALLAAPAQAAFPGENGRIAFDGIQYAGRLAFDDGIYSISPDGNGTRRLTPSFAIGDATWSPDGSKLLFSSVQDGNSGVYRITAGGASLIRLSPLGTPDRSPTWAPDGNRIAFERWEFGRESCGTPPYRPPPAIYTMNADGSAPTRLSQGFCGKDALPDWSPDGASIAFVSGTIRQGQGEPFETSAVFVMNPDGSGRTQLTPEERGELSAPDWSPDNSRIVFSRRETVYTMNADGSGVQQVAEGRNPAWSPDGTKIVFDRGACCRSSPAPFNGYSAVFTANTDGSDERMVTGSLYSAHDPEWQPVPSTGDARSSALSPEVGSRTFTIDYSVFPPSDVASVELWVRTPGAASYSLAATDSSPESPSFDFDVGDGPDGVYRFYTRIRDSAGGYELAPDEPDTETLVDTAAPSSGAGEPVKRTSTAFDVPYSAADSGAAGLVRVELWVRGPGEGSFGRVATDSTRAGSGTFHFEAPPVAGVYELHTRAADRAGNTEAAPPIADVSVDVVEPPPPPRGSIAFASDRDSNYDIYHTNSDGTGWTRQLTFHDADDRSPAWSPTGSSIAFASDRDGDYDIYLMRSDGTAVRQLTNAPGADTDPAWSPDGRIAFTSNRDGHREIYVMQANGSGQRRVTHAPITCDDDGDCWQRESWNPSWSPDGQRIVFLGGRYQGLRIIRADGTQELDFCCGYTSSPDWSLDDRIAAAGDYDGGKLYYRNSDGTGYTLVHERSGASPAWSPDATALAFVLSFDSGHRQNAEIVQSRDDGEGLQRLTYNPAFDGDPDWQPRVYRSVKRFCDAQRAQIGADAFARLYGADGGKGKKSAERACRKSHRG